MKNERAINAINALLTGSLNLDQIINYIDDVVALIETNEEITITKYEYKAIRSAVIDYARKL